MTRKPIPLAAWNWLGLFHDSASVTGRLETEMDIETPQPHPLASPPDPAAIEARAESLRALGLLSPPLIWDSGPPDSQEGPYVILDGHKTVAAARAMQWESLDCAFVDRRTVPDDAAAAVIYRALHPDPAAIPAASAPAGSPSPRSAEQIRAARNGLGWTQRQLAERASVHARTVKMIEAGRTKPMAATARGLARAFGSAGVLFGHDGRTVILPGREGR